MSTGWICQTVCQAMREATRQIPAAIGSRDLAKAQAFAEQHGIAAAHGSYEDLVNDPTVDIVYIGTPYSEHFANARLALEAGKPVLLEKSFTLTQAEGQQLADLAAQRGLFLMEAMWTRFLPHQRELRQRIADGALGELITAVADHGSRDPIDPTGRFYGKHLGGGSLYDRGIYPVSWIVDLFGLPDSVQAYGQLTATGVDADMSAILGYAKRGAQAFANSSIRARTPWTAWLAGSKGRVVVEEFWHPTTLQLYLGDAAVEVWQYPVRSHGYEYELAAVAEAVTDGLLTHPIMPSDQTVAILGILDQIRNQLKMTW
jgi:predicted dehydrogenase